MTGREVGMGVVDDMRGNRMRVPDALGGRHFFYKTAPPQFDEWDVDLVVRTIKSTVQSRGLACAEIQTFSARGLDVEVDGAGDAMRRLARLMPGRELRLCEPSVLVCEWASVHVDETFSGAAFLSFVLHTGEHPYVMQTLHTDEVRGLQEVTSTTRVLSKGDGFVFDPTTAHMVAPRYSATGQMLIVIQAEMRDADESDRRALLAAVPQMEGDGDEGREIGR
jgi:hypothetical protein